MDSTKPSHVPNISSGNIIISHETSTSIAQPAPISSTGLLIPITISTIIIAAITIAIAVPISIHNGKKNSNEKSYIKNKNTTDSELQYGCFVDAGSSSSRVYIYNWPKDYLNSIPIITQLNKSERYTPALGKTKNDEEIENIVNIYINFCEKGINNFSNKSANIKKSPFFLKATAGMRKLSENEQNKKINIVRNLIKNSKFLFDEDDWIRVINGRDEGIYGWVSLNYLKNILNENNNEGKIIKKTFGVIESGGSSIEVTFLPETKNNKDFENDISNIQLGIINYNVYSHVYDFYGQDDSYEKLLKLLIKNNNNDEIISHPCLGKGFNTTYNDSGILYNFYGNYNETLCLNLTYEILNITECTKIEDSDSAICTMNGVKQPKFNENQKFYGMGSLTYMGNFFGFGKNDYYSPKEVLETAVDYCNEDASKVKEENPNISEDYLKIYCYCGHYYYNMFIYSLGFDENWKSIIFSNEVNNTESGWNFGSMIYDVGNLQS